MDGRPRVPFGQYSQVGKGVLPHVFGVARMRKRLLTESVLAQIPRWITEEGLRPTEMAARIGCTVGSLRVTCSRYRISLRQLINRKTYSSQPPIRADSTLLVLKLPEDMRGRIQAEAASLGASEVDFVTRLLQTIDSDDLYSAVLDESR